MQVSAVSVAQPLPPHLEDITAGSLPSLGEKGRLTLKYILHRYVPGDPVTGCTQAVRHDIETNGTRPVRCGPRRLAPTGLRTEQECTKDMLEGGQIESSGRQRLYE